MKHPSRPIELLQGLEVQGCC